MIDTPTARMKTFMEIALERTCLELPYGGGHELRKFIASRLLDAAWTGHATLGELGIVARKAFADYLATVNKSRIA